MMDLVVILSISVGGLVRDHNGYWIKGSNKFIGRGTSILAKLWAIFYGIELVVQLGCSSHCRN